MCRWPWTRRPAPATSYNRRTASLPGSCRYRHRASAPSICTTTSTSPPATPNKSAACLPHRTAPPTAWPPGRWRLLPQVPAPCPKHLGRDAIDAKAARAQKLSDASGPVALEHDLWPFGTCLYGSATTELRLQLQRQRVCRRGSSASCL